MSQWDPSRYEEEKRRFIQRGVDHAPLWWQFTLMFATAWGAAWLCSWFLLAVFAGSHAWAGSLPVRYAIAFAFAYACFFLAVRVWIDFVKADIVKGEPETKATLSEIARETGDFGLGGADAEGCLYALALLAIGCVVGGLFYLTGGAPLLLEAAFEATFAGVVVRGMSGKFVLGDWKMRLLANTWKQALAGLVGLVVLAAWLQEQAPAARTLAEAVRTIMHGASG